ncbi:hypothetical protein P691DRAFT_636600, partial [Macrolepiota fuliginosa MF-IS2]
GQSECMKAHEPDTFDGSDPKKLSEWLFQLKLYFGANYGQFTTANSHINFTITYLCGTTLSWFHTILANEEDFNYTSTPLLNEWKMFKEELTKCFGSINTASEAAEELDNLWMGHNQQIIKYDLEFICLSSLVK